MGTSKRERRSVMIETTLCISFGMACKTCCIIIGISIDPGVFTIRFRFIIVRVTGNTGELAITGSIGMAVRADIPFRSVFP